MRARRSSGWHAVLRERSGQDRDEVFRRVLEREHATLVRVAYAIVRNTDDANDALHDAVASTYGKWRSGRVQDLAKYLNRSVRNAALGIAKSHQRQIKASDALAVLTPPGHPAADVPYHEEVQRAEVWSTFHALSHECQTILRMRKLENVPVKEVAAQLHVSEGTVKSRCSRCLEQLGRMLGAFDAD